MTQNEIEVKIKVGEIEFYAKGQPADVKEQSQYFIGDGINVLLAIIDTINRSRRINTDNLREMWQVREKENKQ